MAGIGFELKKIYRKDGIARSLMGAFYSSMITIGPTLVVIVTILILYFLLDMGKVGVYERELLSDTILYTFIFSVILTSPFNSVFSRYLADKFYQEEYDDILCSYYMGIMTVAILGMLIGLPVFLSLYFRGGVDLPYILAAYVLWASAVLVFFSITYIHATKNYKQIAFMFLFSMVAGGVASWLLTLYSRWDKIHCILYGLALAFFLIAMLEFAYIRGYFQGKGQNYGECMRYLWRYRWIFLTNLFYALGLYVHNFVFWTAPGRLYIANTFYSHQAYDMATCLAMFTNISTMVIFTVIAETRFHEAYQKYMESVIGGTYRAIQKNKRIMFRTLSQQLSQVFSLQIAITGVLFLVVIIFGLRLGFSSLTLRIYPALAAGYIGVFMMYDNIVYLYYFEDNLSSMLTGLIFFAGTLLGSILSACFLPAELYGMGLFFGMLCGFTFSFWCIRRTERDFEAHIFCRYKIINTMKSSAKGEIVYRKEGGR